MSESTERIGQIRAEAEDAIAAATTSEALEEARIRYLGRKAELPNLLREVANLPPEERAATGKAANEARQALERAIERRQAELAGQELDRRLQEDRVDVTLPADPLPNLGGLHLIAQTRSATSRSLRRPRVQHRRRPRGRDRLLQLRRAQPRRRTHPSRQKTDTFYVTDDVVLRTHTSAGADPHDGAHPPPVYMAIPGRVYRRDTDATHTPQFTQIEGLAVDRGVTLARPEGHARAFARAIFGARARGAAAAALLPVHRAVGRGRRVVLQLRRRRHLRRGDAASARARAGSRSSAPAWSTPTCSSYVRDPATTPSGVQGFAFGMGVERVAVLSTASPTSGCSSTTTCGSWSSSDEGPARVAARVRAVRLAPRGRWPSASTMTGTKLEGLQAPRRRGARPFRVGRVLDAEQHPDADRLSVCLVDVGDGRAAADRVRRDQLRGRRQRSRSPCPARCCPTDRARHGEAARRRVARDDALRARARARRASTTGSCCCRTTWPPPARR